VFGLGRRRRAAAAEAARDAERRHLFAQLAQRPAHICPFLGLAYERTGYVEGPSIEHRCFAFGEPAPLSSGQQTGVCQQRGYGHCPRYLRGLLVTPTAELEALRDARPGMGPPSPPRAPTPAPAEVERGIRGRRRLLLAVVIVLVLLLVAIAAAYLLLVRGIPVKIELGDAVRDAVAAVLLSEAAPAS
jgi:hypothetical protein